MSEGLLAASQALLESTARAKETRKPAGVDRYSRAAADRADFAFRLSLAARHACCRLWRTADTSGNGFGHIGWAPGAALRGLGGTGISTGQTSTIHVGVVDVDMYDVAERQLVWEGMASKTIDPKAKPDKQQKNLEKAVAQLLKNYPPEKK